MADPTGEASSGVLRLDFDRRLILQFRGSAITSDAGLLPYRELDDVLALTTTGGQRLADARTGKNSQHLLVGLLRQSVFGRLAGYEDVNDANRLCRDPAMRWVVGDRAITGSAASASQMGRFETKWLTRPENLVALADLPGRWIDKVHRRRPPKIIVLDMDSSESPTYGEQEGSAYNGDGPPEYGVTTESTLRHSMPVGGVHTIISAAPAIFNCRCSPITWATSCARSRCPRPRRRGPADFHDRRRATPRDAAARHRSRSAPSSMPPPHSPPKSRGDSHF
jgi:hypothetical protein